ESRTRSGSAGSTASSAASSTPIRTSKRSSRRSRTSSRISDRGCPSRAPGARRASGGGGSAGRRCGAAAGLEGVHLLLHLLLPPSRHLENLVAALALVLDAVDLRVHGHDALAQSRSALIARSPELPSEEEAGREQDR